MMPKVLTFLPTRPFTRDKLTRQRVLTELVSGRGATCSVPCHDMLSRLRIHFIWTI